MSAKSDANDEGLFQTPPADSVLPAAIDRRSLMHGAVIGAAAVMTGAALTPEARAILERQAAWLRRYPNVRLLVEGNCDERGTREYNLALGARRAAAARDYIVSLGISGDRLTTVSYGKERPMDPRSNEQAWSVNRNAHSTIVSGAVS